MAFVVLDPAACPWQSKNIELCQEAMAQGLKNKNQPFNATGTQQKHRYCFSYKNNGFCKAKGCPRPHVCQICTARHHKRQCPKFRQNNKPLSQTLNKAQTTAQTHWSQLESSDSIVTPINVQQLQNYSSGYNQASSDFLIEGFSQSFKIPYIGDRRFKLSQNLSSLIGKGEILHNKFDKGIEAKRVSPVHSLPPPFPDFPSLPLGPGPEKGS